ncbi:MAG: hypothetical protein AAB369_01470, partial [Chloroflexota bacterium]
LTAVFTVNPFTVAFTPGYTLTGLGFNVGFFVAPPAAPGVAPGVRPPPQFMLNLPLNMGALISGTAANVGLTFRDPASGLVVTPNLVSMPFAFNPITGITVAILNGTPNIVQGTGTQAQITVQNLYMRVVLQTQNFFTQDPRVGNIAFSVPRAPLRSSPTNRSSFSVNVVSPFNARSRVANFRFYRGGRSGQVLPGSFGPLELAPVGFSLQAAEATPTPVPTPSIPFVKDVAYAISIVTVDLSTENTEIVMGVDQAWVDSVGEQNIAILRESDDGDFSILATRRTGTDEEKRAIFEGMSPDGVGIFYLTAFEQPPPQPTPTSTATPAPVGTPTPV